MRTISGTQSFPASQWSLLTVNSGLKLPWWRRPWGAKFLFSGHQNAMAFTVAYTCSSHVPETQSHKGQPKVSLSETCSQFVVLYNTAINNSVEGFGFISLIFDNVKSMIASLSFKILQKFKNKKVIKCFPSENHYSIR